MSSLSVSETSNKFPERLLVAIDFSYCLLTPGIFFLWETTINLCLPTNWTGTCTLVYIVPDISIVPNNQTLPIPLTHNWPRQAIQFIPLLVSFRNSGLDWNRDHRTHNFFELLSKTSIDLTDSLEEIANSLLIIQTQQFPVSCGPPKQKRIRLPHSRKRGPVPIFGGSLLIKHQ